MAQITFQYVIQMASMEVIRALVWASVFYVAGSVWFMLHNR